MSEPSEPAQVTSLLECGICLDKFTDPRALPCLHSYCMVCLERHVSATRNPEGVFRCPLCRDKCNMPAGGVNEFPKNFLANSLAGILPNFVFEPLPSTNSQQAGNQQGSANNDNSNDGEERGRTPNCEPHPGQKINWFCRTCSLPGCADCILESHKNHNTEKLAVVVAMLNDELRDISGMATQRSMFLKQMLADIESNKRKMEEDLDKASKAVSDTANNMCKLIRQHESTLQAKITEERTTARNHFDTASKELEIANDNTSSIKSCADTLRQAPEEYSLCTIVQAPINKRQFLHQRDVRLAKVKWAFQSGLTESGRLSTAGFLCSTQLKVFSKVTRLPVDVGSLQAPTRTIKIVDKALKKVMAGIALIHKSMLCITFNTKDIWVYNMNTGTLKGTVEIPRIPLIYGIVAVDSNQGKLAIVDGTDKLHFVTLSVDLKLLHHTIQPMPVKATRLAQNTNGELLVTHAHEMKITVLTADGQVVSTVNVLIPQDKALITSATQTTSGFVVCDSGDPRNKKVYFTDTDGRILHTSADSVDPRQAVYTSWGHVLISDYEGNQLKIFNEKGAILGEMKDKNGGITDSIQIHVDEKERLLYVGRGTEGNMEIRVYNFVPRYLPSLPVNVDVVTVQVDATFAKVTGVCEYCLLLG